MTSECQGTSCAQDAPGDQPPGHSDWVEPRIAVLDPCEKAHCQASLSCTRRAYDHRAVEARVQTLMDNRQGVCQ